jgi:hypothetical protein
VNDGSRVHSLRHALNAHGLHGAIAERVEEVGQELRALQAAEGVEFAAMLDVETGAPVGPYLRGTPTSVVIEPHLSAMKAGRLYVQVHSHPSAATFSIDDVAVLFHFYPTLHSTVVVAAAAWWYVMSPRPGTDPYPVTKIHRAYLDAWRRLEPQFLTAIDEGKMTTEQAGLELHRAIWRTIAGDLNFLYHEVEVGTT